MDSILRDLRYAWRGLLRRPAFSALAILTLAVGVGVNAVAFTAVDALLFHPFRFPGVNRLGWIMLAGQGHGELSWREFGELERHAGAFDAVAAEGRLPLALTVNGRAEQIFSLQVSKDYFGALGARAEMGRLLDAADASSPDVAAVVSHRFWRDRLDGGSIVGRTMSVNNRDVAIVGVLPDDFQGPGGLYAPDVWLPLQQLPTLSPRNRVSDGEHRWLTVFGRVGPDATVAQARAELAGFAQAFTADTPDPGGRLALQFYEMRLGHPDVRSLSAFVWVAMSIVAVVLLIACFNVAALLLARASERQREIGIRGALGAGRGRIVRQLLIEGLLLASLSGCAALVAAAWSERLLSAFSLPAPIPQRLHMGIDGRLLWFIVAAVAIAGVLPALLPALQATRRDLISSLRVDASFGTGRPSRARSAFVVAQVAGSTLFLALALLFVRSFLAAAAANPGFDLDHAVVATMDPAQYGMSPAASRALIDAVVERLSHTPSVRAAAAGDRAPFYVGFPRTEKVAAMGDPCLPDACRSVLTYGVTPRYFDALGAALIAGREVTPAEARTGDAVIVSESLANELWPGASALGETLRLDGEPGVVRVTGVAADIAFRNRTGRPSPALYRPLADEDLRTGASIVARASGDPRATIAAIRDAAQALAPAVPLTSLQTMAERLEVPMWPYRTAAGFFAVCGSLALVLAMVGLFGVTYFTVRQRTREFGVRIAIGAGRAAIVRQVLREGLALTLLGALLGMVAAGIAGRLVARALVGVNPADAPSLIGAAVVEIVVALLACALPARQASAADPIVALRDT